jgi:acyl-CoA thioesterase FadM
MLVSYALRAAFTATSAIARPRASLLDDVVMPFVAWPSDIDWNGHVNNGQYLTLMDHGRLDHLVRTGLVGLLLKAGCRPVVATASIRFRREILPFMRCRLVTRIRGWDDRRTYFSHRIERDNAVCAEADVAIAIRLNNRTASIVELLSRAGREVPEELLRARVATEVVERTSMA